MNPSYQNRFVFVLVLAATAWTVPTRAADADPSSPIAEALQRADTSVEKILAVPEDQRTMENTILAIDDLLVQLEIDANMPQFMAYVSTDAAERERGLIAEEHYTNWLIELGKNEALYEAVNSVDLTAARLDAEAARLVDHLKRDFRRAGMQLSSEKRAELMKIQKEIARLGIDFEKNIRQDETVVPLTRDELQGMEPEFIDALPSSGDIVMVGMSYPIFHPVMDFCDNESTRQKVWMAYKRRGGKNNVQVLENILRLRAQAAALLGYQHAADYETEVRMARNAENVRAFYDRLRPLVRQKAQLDYEEFLEAKRAHTGDANARLYPWDQFYYQKRLMNEKYAVDAKKVQEYFPLDRAISGLFSITQSLYGLEYRDITKDAKSLRKPIWHEDVKLYEVWDQNDNELLGQFYLDLHPRENKYNHAAQWGLVPRKVWPDGRVEKPLAALVCNFTKPTADKPSLLTHDEVETFFHEFGHCLHTILTETRSGRFAGTGVERDFVEAPSQMFENWVWDAEVLNTFARHYQTGQPLPAELLDGMIRARQLGSGLLAEHQFYYGLVDLAYHTDPEGDADTTKIQHDYLGEIELYEPVPETHFQASFGHLVGYQAGYYGYQWSLVYAQDMFQRFKELGMLNPEAGKYYREKILARGGTLDGLELVKDYLGREPSTEPYLKYLGLERPE